MLFFFSFAFLHHCSRSSRYCLWRKITESLTSLVLPNYAEIVYLTFFPLVLYVLKVYQNPSSILYLSCHDESYLEMLILFKKYYNSEKINNN